MAVHRLQVAFAAGLFGTAFPLASFGRGGGVGDAAMAERDKMIDDERGARPVVVYDRVVLIGGVMVTDYDGRDCLGDVNDLRTRHRGGNQDEAVHRAVDHGVSEARLILGAEPSRPDQDLEVSLCQSVGDPVEKVAVEGVADAVETQAGREAPAAHASGG